MLEFESLLALRTLELPQHGALVVAYHVALQAVDVRKCLVAHFTGLLKKINRNVQLTQVPQILTTRSCRPASDVCASI